MHINNFIKFAKEPFLYCKKQSSGIDVYQYDTNQYLYTIEHFKNVKKIIYKDGLIMVQFNLNNLWVSIIWSANDY